MEKRLPWQIRKQLKKMLRQRKTMETTLLEQRRGMMKACLIPRRKLAGGRLRQIPAFYLSRKVKGKTRLVYVRKNDLETVRDATDRWREFSSTLAEWAKLTTRIEKLFRELGKAQQTSLPES